ncbi:MAG: hypothetical protein MUC28_03085 [Planctomycetes bacterium]|jgi:hypothetical protein|nr:hypothetical protein [Planctomycetota bacterium]
MKRILYITVFLLSLSLSANLYFIFRDQPTALAPTDINGSSAVNNDTGNIGLPLGYTLDRFQVEKISTTTCARHEDCQTPFEYLVQSRCPFTSLCLNGLCSVVCPGNDESK